ncbi:hypothetical protein KY359_03885 [Candidatus Woesearchaeota archaeon]|nr:hypothetical protein [Candidatus Woesearchaeota archaeon]
MEPSPEKQKRFRVNYGCISIDDRVETIDSAHPAFFDKPEDLNEFLRGVQCGYTRMGYKLFGVSILEWNGAEYVKRNRGDQPFI